MKIVHIAPNSPYNDYWGYQDNLLPKYHKKLGHEVVVVTTNTMHKDGQIIETNCADYVLNDGVRVVRLKREKYSNKVLTNLRSKLKVYSLLCEIQPDFVFFHGLISSTIFDVIKYKKKINPECKIVQDNHMDYNNGKNTNGIKSKIICRYYRLLNRRSIKYIERVYGVTPWRKRYAEEYFNISKKKTDVLIMGADDEKIDFLHREGIRHTVRSNNGIKDTEYLVVTGGKLDKAKNIIELMKSCADLPNVKLLVFGSLTDESKGEFNSILSKSNNIVYIGWIDADKVYNYFLAADLVCFPGTHSVLWEQACACKVPCLFKKWDDMEHLDNGGNSSFIERVTWESLKNRIKELYFTEEYYEMRKNACSDKTDVYLYSKIAKKSLEVANKKDK